MRSSSLLPPPSLPRSSAMADYLSSSLSRLLCSSLLRFLNAFYSVDPPPVLAVTPLRCGNASLSRARVSSRLAQRPHPTTFLDSPQVDQQHHLALRNVVVW